MNDVRTDPCTCESLARALADGRFAEDPKHWGVHVDACAACRASVEGYLELRKRIEKARLELPGEAAPLNDPQAVIAHAMARYRLLRARRATVVGASAVLVVALGSVVLLGRGATPSYETAEAADVDALELAVELQRIVVPGYPAPARFELLQSDAQLRARFEAALDHSSAVVRRVALSALTSSGIVTDPRRLEEVLRTWNEDLEISPSLASAPGADRGRLAAAVLASGRAQTLQAALSAALLLAARGGEPVSASVVLPHLEDGDVDVQVAALAALQADPGYVPGEELEKLLANPRQHVKTRTDAAYCLEARLGDEGVRRIVAVLGSLEDGGEIEPRIATAVVKQPAGLPWARDRMNAAGTPIRTALAYAQALIRVGQPVSHEALVPRGLKDGTPETARLLLECCWRSDWTQYRAALQEYWMTLDKAWRKRPGGDEDGVATAMYLLTWDEAAGTPERLGLALDLCEAIGQHQGTWIPRWLGRIASHTDPKVALRARELLTALGGK